MDLITIDANLSHVLSFMPGPLGLSDGRDHFLVSALNRKNSWEHQADLYRVYHGRHHCLGVAYTIRSAGTYTEGHNIIDFEVSHSPAAFELGELIFALLESHFSNQVRHIHYDTWQKRFIAEGLKHGRWQWKYARAALRWKGNYDFIPRYFKITTFNTTMVGVTREEQRFDSHKLTGSDLTPSEKPWEQLPDVSWDRDAVQLLCRGLTDREIAKRVGKDITAKTVSNRLSVLRQQYPGLVPTREELKKRPPS